MLLNDKVNIRLDFFAMFSVQRFEFTFEAVWKAALIYIKEIEGLDVGSPKGVLRN